MATSKKKTNHKPAQPLRAPQAVPAASSTGTVIPVAAPTTEPASVPVAETDKAAIGVLDRKLIEIKVGIANLEGQIQFATRNKMAALEQMVKLEQELQAAVSAAAGNAGLDLNSNKKWSFNTAEMAFKEIR